jgi:hypothetical protein
MKRVPNGPELKLTVRALNARLDYVEAYANIHFNPEERCMESFLCPAHAQNETEQARFRGFIRDYENRREVEKH